MTPEALQSTMLKMQGYEIVTFQRKPGLWRASITPTADNRETGIGTRQIRSFLTDEDCTSEAEAEKSAASAIRNISK